MQKKKKKTHSFIFFSFLRAIRITILVCRMEKLPRVLGRKKKKKSSSYFYFNLKLNHTRMHNIGIFLYQTGTYLHVSPDQLPTAWYIHVHLQYKSLVTPSVLLTFFEVTLNLPENFRLIFTFSATPFPYPCVLYWTHQFGLNNIQVLCLG